MELSVITGEAALQQLRCQDFQAHWQELYEKCPWKTTCQSPLFVLTWFEIYQKNYEAILVKANAADGELHGLLILAHHHAGKLVCAGNEQAEYQAWLALPENSSEFMRTAIRTLKQHFPQQTLSFTYLPPNAPLDWLQDQSLKPYCILRAYKRPLRIIDPQRSEQSRRKKTMRYHLNQLRRLGEIRFEAIEEPQRQKQLLDEFILYYNFRQSARYNASPFLDDPLKRAYYLAMLRENLLHVTALFVADKVVSLNFGLKNHDQLLLGLTHSPFYAKHSPGSVHLSMLCRELAQEGYSFFDLTPGGQYKDQHATSYDQVHSLLVCCTPRQKLGYQLRAALSGIAKRGLSRLGQDPLDLMYRLKRMKGQGVYRRCINALKKLQNRRIAVYQYPDEQVTDANPTLIRKNRLEDLLAYHAARFRPGRWEFLEAAMRRIERGHIPYTYVKNNKLYCCLWFSSVKDCPIDAELSQLPKDAYILFDYYMAPEMEDPRDYKLLLKQAVRDLKGGQPTTLVFIGSRTDDSVMNSILGQIQAINLTIAELTN